MVKLTPIEQVMFVKAQPAVFNPALVPGAAAAPQISPEGRQEAYVAPVLSKPPGVLPHLIH